MTSAFKSGTPAHGEFVHDVTSTWTVGPGAYRHTGMTDRLPDGGTHGFRSGRTKAVKDKLRVPGPGAYDPYSDARARRHLGAPATPSTSFTWTRRPTAPSIPTLQMAMGYEEDGAGQLVPQEAPKPPKGGVAPNRYSPSTALTQRATLSPDFGASMGRSLPIVGTFVSSTEGLAPGCHTGVTANPRPRRPVPSTSFANKTEKDVEWHPWEGPPGPKYSAWVRSELCGGTRPIKDFPRQRRHYS